MSPVMDKVAACEKIIDYQFSDKRHCVDALFAYSGYCHEFGTAVLIKKNDGMGILGDIILQLHLCEKWLGKGLSTKDWNEIRQQVASNTNLASVGKSRGLDKCVVLNPGMTSVPDSVMATTCEAIIAAVSLDGGDEAVERLLERLSLSHALLNAVISNAPLLKTP